LIIIDLVVNESLHPHQFRDQLSDGSRSCRHPQLTSLTLEILFYFGKLYDYFFWILSLLVFIYKGKIDLSNGHLSPGYLRSVKATEAAATITL
jgi:hypothetical protein